MFQDFLRRILLANSEDEVNDLLLSDDGILKSYHRHELSEEHFTLLWNSAMRAMFSAEDCKALKILKE